MSSWDKSYEERYQERREEERQYEADFRYETWRSGGDPDTIDMDRVREYQDEGHYADEAAINEMNRQYRKQTDQEEDDYG